MVKIKSGFLGLGKNLKQTERAEGEQAFGVVVFNGAFKDQQTLVLGVQWGGGIFQVEMVLFMYK